MACLHEEYFDTPDGKRCMLCFEPWVAPPPEVQRLAPECTNCGQPMDSFQCYSCGAQESHDICGDQEWRDFAPEFSGNIGGAVSKSRVGSAQNPLFSEAYTSGTLMKLPAYASRELKRMQLMDFYSQSNHKDRSLHNVYRQIDQVGQNISLPGVVVELSKGLYKHFNSKNKITRGNVRLGVIANCIFTACKKEHVTRTTQEITDAFGITPKDISRTADIFATAMEDHPLFKDMNKAVEATDLIGRLMNALPTPGNNGRRIACKARQALKVYQDIPELMSKTPHALACAAIIAMTSDMFEKADVCRACGVSMPTVVKIEKILAQKKIST